MHQIFTELAAHGLGIPFREGYRLQARDVSRVQPSLRDLPSGLATPSVEMLGYSPMPLRNVRAMPRLPRLDLKPQASRLHVMVLNADKKRQYRRLESLLRLPWRVGKISLVMSKRRGYMAREHRP